MALAGPDERRLTARTNESRRKRLPPSRQKSLHKRIEAMKGVHYLGRKREKDAPWGHSTVQSILLVDPVAAALQAARMPSFTGFKRLPIAEGPW